MTEDQAKQFGKDSKSFQKLNPAIRMPPGTLKERLWKEVANTPLKPATGPASAKADYLVKISQGDKLRGKFLKVWEECGGPALDLELPFHPIRKWRFDFVVRWNLRGHDSFAPRIAIEIDGGAFVQGGHNRGAQMAKDHEKRNTALLMGWRVFTLTTSMMKPEFIAPIAKLANLMTQ